MKIVESLGNVTVAWDDNEPETIMVEAMARDYTEDGVSPMAIEALPVAGLSVFLEAIIAAKSGRLIISKLDEMEVEQWNNPSAPIGR